MADVTVKQHDNYPPLRFKVSDQAGLLDLASADSIKLLLVGPATLEGPITALDPSTNGGYNATYPWPTGQTAMVGNYRGEIEITWVTSPPAIETAPNSGTFEIVIEADLG